MDCIKLLLTLVLFFQGILGDIGTPPRITENPVDLIVPRNDPATLQCSADGTPEPEITWYKDGEVVSVAPGDQISHRVALPGGALFFLRVIGGRRESDGGTYWCVARNTFGVVRSKNATLTVAYLHSEFRALPQPIRAIQGETVLLDCEPPKGQPEPQVRWKKDGHLLDLVSMTPRVRLETTGSLLITEVTSADNGRYQCVAANVAGNRESPSALLSVHVKPEIVRTPQNLSVLSGEDAYFECIATGDPMPLIVWKKGNTQVAEGRSLRLESITPSEQGRYICLVENIVGSDMASAVLTVYVPPTVTFIERFIRVETGSTASLPCTAEGLPSPDLFWTKEGLNNWETLRVGMSLDGDRVSVTDDGTLTIKEVTPEDAGTYICVAVNPGGADVSPTRLLLVSRRLAKIPPVISIGPSNQTLPLRSLGTLQCEAEAATTTWIKDGRVIIPEGRFGITESGALRIEDLRQNDAGTYTCIARNSGGETSWSSTLSIESPTNPNVVFFRSTNDPLALPGSPSQPRLLSRGSSTLTVTWRSGSRTGASPLLGYMIEVLSTDGPVETKGKWRTVAQRLQTDMFTLTNLRPGSSHLVIIRAENSHGLSLPSPPSEWLEISDSVEASDEGELEQVREALSPRVVKLEKVVPVNSTAVRITWEILDSESYMDRLDICFFMDKPESKAQQISIDELGALSMVLAELEPNTDYSFFFIPRGKGVVGRPSNMKSVKTLEDVPSTPPSSITVQVLNTTSVLLHWDEPRQTTGHIVGYQIFIQDSDKIQIFNLTVFSQVTTAIVNSLTPGLVYTVRLLALSKAGSGPLSAPVEFALERDEVIGRKYPREGITADLSEVIRETWFAVLIGSLLVVAVLILAAAILAKKKITQKKALEHLYPNIQKSNDIGQIDNRDGYWVRGWQPKDCDSSLSATKLLPHGHESDPLYAELSSGPMLTSFNHRQNFSAPSAYATTTLVGASYKSGLTPRILSEQPPPDVLADSRGYIHTNPLHDFEGAMLSPSSDSSSSATDTEQAKIYKNRQKGAPNWSDLLPPPPSYPPYQENVGMTFSGNQSIIGIISKPGSVQSTPAVTKRNGIIFTSSDGLNPMTPAPRRHLLASQPSDTRSSSSSRSSNRRKEEQKNPEAERMLSRSAERGVQSSLPSLNCDSFKPGERFCDESMKYKYKDDEVMEFNSALYAETDLINKFWSPNSSVHK
ncbi:protein sax-3-like [Artemia franciscana]|uniref:Roundabout homolog 2-like n=1 Tax=Artemia franciscana TaxID=6661 RepID=A0AA88KXT5_ARTSF|nr:hypothetical protein QYM36_012621 [Artemia franciscana]